MPGEEMEITTDFGHPGYGEDIDIDLDFAVGQPDEDLELGDFDQAQDIQNFNSDTRDELMAEGDDASYGMIDAEDIERNEVATVSNDIEIDLGDPDENLWQEHAPNADEIDYIENTNVGSADAQHVASGEDNWLEASAYSANKPADMKVEQVHVRAINTTGSDLPVETTVPTNVVDTQDIKVPKTGGDDAKAPDNDGTNSSGTDDVLQSLFDSHDDVALDANPQLPANESAPIELGEHEPNDDTQSAEGVSQSNSTDKADGEVQRLDTHNVASGAVEYDQASGSVEHEDEPRISVALDSGFVGEQNLEPEARGESDDLSGPGVSGQQLGGGPYIEPANDQVSVHQEPTQDQALPPEPDDTRTQPSTPNVGLEKHEESHEENGKENQQTASPSEGEHSPSVGETHLEHNFSLASRYEMFISYGQTDYRLFAKSEDDDPNQYFLSDMSALDFTLSQLLSSLRDVIADEISPLDELVMHVDGLGLEFSESSASEIVEQFTFGDILNLYDRLVQNDRTESLPALYTYLMVRPDCRQRIMALFESARTGRGLSEIAVYREATRVDDEPAYELDSQARSILSHDEVEGDYEDDQNNPAEGEAADDDTEEIEDQTGPNSPSAHNSVVETTTRDLTEHAEKPEENLNTNVHGHAADDLIDFSDEELDLSPVTEGKSHPSLPNSSLFIPCNGKSDCQCDACFEIELERLDASWRLDCSRPNLHGSTAKTDHTDHFYQQNLNQSSAKQPADITSHSRISLAGFPSFENLRLSTNTHLIEDHPVNASPRHSVYETQGEHDSEASAEDSNPNQHVPLASGLADLPNSDNTSATATLNGDDEDEIDYSDDDGEDITGGGDAPSNDSPHVPASLKVPIDDEITWESENEDAKNEPITTPKQTVQVSPTSGKRSRSDFDPLDSTLEKNDVKRRRS
ncbi:hypothetical protein AAE478_003873 [Parahypoxylon ruwenzoriense]